MSKTDEMFDGFFRQELDIADAMLKAWRTANAIDRPFPGLYAGVDPREMSREELYDALIETLERERDLLKQDR